MRRLVAVCACDARGRPAIRRVITGMLVFEDLSLKKNVSTFQKYTRNDINLKLFRFYCHMEGI